jgi:hypothetical protein
MTRNLFSKLLWQAPLLLCVLCLVAPFHANAADAYDAEGSH